jgi:uncharacterized protein involved in propanediol utilization
MLLILLTMASIIFMTACSSKATSAVTPVSSSSATTLISITVNPNPVASINVSHQQTFTATGTYSNGSTADISTKVTWNSSDSTIAMFMSSSVPVVTGLAVGTTDVTATLSGITSPPVSVTVISYLPTTAVNP